MKSITKKIKNAIYKLWSIFLKGLLALLPITITVALLNFSFKLLKKWLHPIYQLEPEFLKAIPFSEFLLTFFVICIIGIILNFFILRSLWHFFELLIGKIPLVHPVYKAVKQLVQAFNPHNDQSFKHVVLIEFPRKDIYSIGFMTSEVPAQLSPNKNHTYYNIFLPTTPNPTAGFFLMVDKNNVQITNLSRQEAMALIMSGGIILPDHLSEKK